MKRSSVTQHPAFPWTILFVNSLIWGTSFILIKKGLIGFTAPQVASLRVVFAGLALSPFALRKLNTTFRNNWKLLVPVGIFGNLIPAYLFSLAETGMDSALAGILNSLTPIFTLIIAVIFFKHGLSLMQTTGLLIGFAGTVAISIIGTGGEIGVFNHYAMYVIIATICYGLVGNIIHYKLQHIKTIELTSSALLSVMPIGGVYLLFTDFGQRLATVDAAWASFGYIAILGLVGTAFALLLFHKLLQMKDAVFGSSVTYIMPIIAIAWGVIDGENLEPLHLIGCALILVGVWLANRNQKKKKRIAESEML